MNEVFVCIFLKWLHSAAMICYLISMHAVALLFRSSDELAVVSLSIHHTKNKGVGLIVRHVIV